MHLGRVEGVDKDDPVQLCLEETTKADNVHKGLDLCLDLNALIHRMKKPRGGGGRHLLSIRLESCKVTQCIAWPHLSL